MDTLVRCGARAAVGERVVVDDDNSAPGACAASTAHEEETLCESPDGSITGGV